MVASSQGPGCGGSVVTQRDPGMTARRNCHDDPVFGLMSGIRPRMSALEPEADMAHFFPTGSLFVSFIFTNITTRHITHFFVPLA
jgi:hypothetical protein